MTSWVVIVAVNLGLIASAFWLRRRPRRVLGRLALACGVLLVGSVIIGTGIGLRAGLGAAGGEPGDPSQKATMLSVGISEAANCAASGIATFFLPALAALILFLRSPKDPPPHDEGG
jgi:hypothetical protein